jgi:hypothetical protein
VEPSGRALAIACSRRVDGTPGKAACKKQRGVEKEAALEVERGEANGDVASVRVQGGEKVRWLPSAALLLGEGSFMSCCSAPMASFESFLRKVRSWRLVGMPESKSDMRAAMSELSKEGNSNWTARDRGGAGGGEGRGRTRVVTLSHVGKQDKGQPYL